MTNADFEEILDAAHTAATAAILAHFQAGNREQPFNCGFAWVTIEGTEPLARHCRKMVKSEVGQDQRFSRVYRMKYGDKGEPRGWQWWAPGTWPKPEDVGVPTIYQQDMDFKAAGCRAFQAVLAEHGIRATVGTRLD